MFARINGYISNLNPWGTPAVGAKSTTADIIKQETPLTSISTFNFNSQVMNDFLTRPVLVIEAPKEEEDQLPYEILTF
jgi:hypothetical protein